MSVEFLRETLYALLTLSINTAPFWLVFPLFFIAIEVWTHYKRAEYFASLKYVLLEIRVPKEAPKSPLAMEVVLNALHQTVGESTWYDRIFKGKVRAYFSLEIVSIEGQVRFFIRTRDSLRKFVETQIYSQYPDAEIFEAEDYTEKVPYIQEGAEWDLFGTELILIKPNPYPIKTYVDYNLDKDPKEELKIDPITPVIEFLGDLRRGEQAWIQILVRANKGIKDPTSYWSKRIPWQEESKELVTKIYTEAKERSGPPPSLEEGQTQDFRFSMLTPGEQDVVKAIERNVAKLGFDCGMRALYIAKKENYDPSNVAGLFGTVKQYNSNNLNGFKPRIYTDIDYPWQKYITIPPESISRWGVWPVSFSGKRVAYMKWGVFDAYRRRAWFFPPYERKPFVLNSEELATIYHFPGEVSGTPTFERIVSKKSEPPANLPL